MVPANQGLLFNPCLASCGTRELGILPNSWEKGILMASLGLCVFPSQNDKSSTPGLKSNTPTPRNDAPTPGTSTTPGLRSMPGKPPGMDPIGIMGRHHWAQGRSDGGGEVGPWLGGVKQMACNIVCPSWGFKGLSYQV